MMTILVNGHLACYYPTNLYPSGGPLIILIVGVSMPLLSAEYGIRDGPIEQTMLAEHRRGWAPKHHGEDGLRDVLLVNSLRALS